MELPEDGSDRMIRRRHVRQLLGISNGDVRDWVDADVLKYWRPIEGGKGFYSLLQVLEIREKFMKNEELSKNIQ